LFASLVVWSISLSTATSGVSTLSAFFGRFGSGGHFERQKQADGCWSEQVLILPALHLNLIASDGLQMPYARPL